MLDQFGDILTVPEVADILMVGRNTVYDLLAEGKLKGFRIGKKIWKVPRESLEQYIKTSASMTMKHSFY